MVAFDIQILAEICGGGGGISTFAFSPKLRSPVPGGAGQGGTGGGMAAAKDDFPSLLNANVLAELGLTEFLVSSQKFAKDFLVQHFLPLHFFLLQNFHRRNSDFCSVASGTAVVGRAKTNGTTVVLCGNDFKFRERIGKIVWKFR